MADLESRVLAALEEHIAALEKENAELQNHRLGDGTRRMQRRRDSVETVKGRRPSFLPLRRRKTSFAIVTNSTGCNPLGRVPNSLREGSCA